MVILIVERVSPSLRGELTRWLIQPGTGVFVGRISALVRDHLWERVKRSLKGGGATMIYNAPTEQGFKIQTAGKTDRTIEDFEGLFLAKKVLKG